MTGELTSAAAAIMGAVVGGLASLTSTLLGERSRHRRDLVQREISKARNRLLRFHSTGFQAVRRVCHAPHQ